MTAPSSVQGRIADPRTLARISQLELRARLVVEGIISGMHRSPHRGYSVEFAQHRDYSPGDDLRHMDWKVYGRSDRLYVKQFEEETNLKAHLMVDASVSMLYSSGELSKLEYASIVAAALASLLLRQRDSVGLALFSDKIRSFLPAAGTPAHLRQAITMLEHPVTAPKTNLGATFHDMAERVKRRGMIIILSDFFGDLEEVLKGLQHFRHRKHEVILFHVLDPFELSFPFRDTAIFEGMENEGPLTVEPSALRAEYLKLLREFTETLKIRSREMRMDYMQLVTDAPPADRLARYLSLRSRQ